MNDNEIVVILNLALDNAVREIAGRFGFNEKINESVVTREEIIQHAFAGIEPSMREADPECLQAYWEEVFCACFEYDLSRQAQNN